MDRLAKHEWAVRWVGGVPMSLGDLPGGVVNSDAIASDGTAIVGRSSSASGPEGFLWTPGGGMIGLGDLPGGATRSFAHGTTPGGAPVVGSSVTAGGDAAFLWTPSDGMRPLLDVLQDDYGLDLTGWTLFGAEAISDDGRVIVGNGMNPDGAFVPWVAVLPEPATAVLVLVGLAGVARMARPR